MPKVVYILLFLLGYKNLFIIVLKFKFSRTLRLITKNQFSFVFSNPQRASISQITILGRFNQLDHARIGLAIAKKYVKLSCKRNRIKRLIRESFRLNQHILPNMDFVVIAKQGIIDLDNYAITEALEILWHNHCRISQGT